MEACRRLYPFAILVSCLDPFPADCASLVCSKSTHVATPFVSLHQWSWSCVVKSVQVMVVYGDLERGAWCQWVINNNFFNTNSYHQFTLFTWPDPFSQPNDERKKQSGLQDYCNTGHKYHSSQLMCYAHVQLLRHSRT